MKENAIACPETIKKRNGTPVPFDVNKIRSAIHKANEAAQIEAIAPVQFEKLRPKVFRMSCSYCNFSREFMKSMCNRGASAKL